MPDEENALDSPPELHFEPSDYGAFVIQVLSRHTSTGSMDQPALRHCLGLSSSYLISDTTMNTETGASSGLTTWNTGFNRLVDLLVVLHVRGELELQTMDVASKACSECWTVAGAWDMVEARKCVKVVAGKLQGLLDENKRTYKNQPVYSP